MTAGAYIHIPFCKSRCSYCDFATDVYRDNNSVERYVSGLCREIESAPLINGIPPFRHGSDLKPRIDTIYFGGGTPSLLTPQQVERILIAVDKRFTLTDGIEITIEMNPATVSPESLAGYRSLGINRASFGVQTFNDIDLKLLARGHDADDARQTYKMLRNAGFTNVSFDLIAGLPGQSIDDWSRNLDEAIEMSPEHLSLYLLEIHESTPLAEQVRSGRRTPIDDELAAQMYEMLLDRLAAAGYEQYEISNFSRPGFESRHNSKYWTLDPVFGFGVSAHSFDGQRRYANERDTNKYVAMLEAKKSPVIDDLLLSNEQLSSDYAFLSLRLSKGVNLSAFQNRFGIVLTEKYAAGLSSILDAGLVTLDDENLFLTRKGMLYSNEVFQVFV